MFYLIGVTDYTVCERITLNWSARSCLMWNYAFKSFKYVHNEDNVYKALDDISVLTKKRAMFEYGLLVRKYSKRKHIKFINFLFFFVLIFDYWKYKIAYIVDGFGAKR